MKLAAVGFTCTDVYQNTGISYPTGNGIDWMFNLAELLPETEQAVVTAVGDDTYGKAFLDKCLERGADISHVRVVSGASSAVVEMRMNGTDRVHYHTEKGVIEGYSLTGADVDFIRTRDCIHTDLSWDVVQWLPEMRRNGTQIYFDFSKRAANPLVPEICKHIDYGIFSFEEETGEVLDILRDGCRAGAKILIATFGEKGSVCYDGTEYYRQACIPASKTVNTVGAGDAYGAGFMSGIFEGKSIPECMRLGAEKASEIVSIFGPYAMRNI